MWKGYSLATGFFADVAALTVSAVVSDRVTATARGVVTAAAILELGPFGSNLVLNRSARRVRVATTSQERGANILAGLAAVAFGGAWLIVGVAIADWLTPGFNIDGVWAYIGTLAAVAAATGIVYMPIYLVRKWRS